MESAERTTAQGKKSGSVHAASVHGELHTVPTEEGNSGDRARPLRVVQLVTDAWRLPVKQQVVVGTVNIAVT